MKNLMILFFIARVGALSAQPAFDHWFEDKTLRIDYVHTGDATGEQISLETLYQEGEWPGRTIFLLDTLNLGQYLARVIDAESGQLIYSQGFSSVYGEWETTDEAKTLRRSISETVRIPYPRRPVTFDIHKRDRVNRFQFLWSVNIDPSSRAVNREKKNVRLRTRKLIDNGDPKQKVDVAIMGDGYTQNDLRKFRRDVEHFIQVLFSSPPFDECRRDFNVWAVESVSSEHGIDEPRENIWRDTILGAQYNAFDVSRYVLTFNNRSVRDVAALVPYDAIYILINSSQYGGGGIFNQYAICYTGERENQPAWWADYVFVHEFGHSFAALADEYYTSDVAYNDLYPLDVEPWEPNITTLQCDGKAKWHDLLTPGLPVPTPWGKAAYDSLSALRNNGNNVQEIGEQMDKLLKSPELLGKIGCFEGGGYASQGVYRPALNCRMFSKSLVEFCPVCKQAIRQMIDFTVGRSSVD